MAAISSYDGKPWLGNVIAKLKQISSIDTVLDIGVGEGGYYDLYRNKVGNHWTGVEIFTPYLEQFNLNNKYDVIINDDARNLPALPSADLVFAGDVLEHLTKEDAIVLYDHLLDTCGFVAISLPIIHFPQEAEDGNDHQAHLADWTHDEILATFGHIQTWYRGKICGVYIASKKHRIAIPTHTFPRVAVYGIAKNEINFVDRMVNSALDADAILITDTGSTDGTFERLRDLEQTHPGKVMAHRVSVNPWRFDMARNVSLALLPDDIDICISLDLDEVLASGWRQKLDADINTWTTRIFYHFAWAKNDDGSDRISFWGDKCHARFGYQWKYPVHEVIEHYGSEEEHVQYIKFGLDHYPDNSKPRSQYLPLLEQSCKESPTYGKNSLYLGREYFFYDRYNDAITELNRYLTLTEANWGPDRASAHRYMAKCYGHKGDLQMVEAHLLQAVADAPDLRENWGDLVQHFYSVANWAKCYGAVKTFLITAPTDHYLYDPKFYGAFGQDMLALSAWYLGYRDEAIEAAKAALAVNPEDQRLQSNLALMLAANGA